MPKVSNGRDDAMSQNNLLRATILAKLLNVSTSTITKWPDAAVPKIRVSGLCWCNYTQARAFRQVESDSIGLPADAVAALEYARVKGLV